MHETNEVRVIAHRGSSHDFPEHSLAAYVDAIEQGADGLECDVRLTADGHLVCVHDATLQRVAASRGRVAAMTLEELRRVDWHGGHPGPLTLRDLFALVADSGRNLEIAVETKHPNRYGGQVEQAVCDLADWFGWLPTAADDERETSGPDVRLMSFSAAALGRAHRRAPRLPLVFLLEKPLAAATRTVLPGRAVACGVDIALIHDEPGWAAAIVAAGHELAVWTVDDTADMDAALAAGSNRLITNRPRVALDHLRDRKSQG